MPELERAKERMKDVQFVATMRAKDFAENRTFREWTLIFLFQFRSGRGGRSRTGSLEVNDASN